MPQSHDVAVSAVETPVVHATSRVERGMSARLLSRRWALAATVAVLASCAGCTRTGPDRSTGRVAPAAPIVGSDPAFLSVLFGPDVNTANPGTGRGISIRLRAAAQRIELPRRRPAFLDADADAFTDTEAAPHRRRRDRSTTA